MKKTNIQSGPRVRERSSARWTSRASPSDVRGRTARSAETVAARHPEGAAGREDVVTPTGIEPVFQP